MIRRHFLLIASLCASTLPLHALAQNDYPNKPIKLIVPFPAGGTSDVMGRLIAEELSKSLKQTMVGLPVPCPTDVALVNDQVLITTARQPVPLDALEKAPL